MVINCAFLGPPPSNDVPAGPYPIVVTKRNGKKCLVVQAYAYTKYLGRLNVTFDSVGDVISWTGNPVLLDRKIASDASVLSDIARMKSLVDKVGKVRIVYQNLLFYQSSLGLPLQMNQRKRFVLVMCTA